MTLVDLLTTSSFPDKLPLIVDTLITVFANVVLKEPNCTLVVFKLLTVFDNVLLILLTLLFVPVTTLLRLLILVTAPESVPLRFVILLLVVDK